MHMSRLLGKSKVWGRGYTTIPVTVRRVLGLRSSDEIEWYLGDNGEIIIRKVGGRDE